MIETWADFRDDDAVDVAILTGAGEAFCAGADLKTYIPPIIEDATPGGSARSSTSASTASPAACTGSPSRSSRAVNGWALAGGLETALACDIRIASDRAMFGSFEARRGYHHGDGGIVRLVNTCGVGVAMQMLLTAEPIDAAAGAAPGTWSRRSSRTTTLMEEAEIVARQILRNSQPAVRSAKETILDVIGQPLDDQLRTEAWNAYTCADPEETHGAARALLRQDRRRPGRRARDGAVSGRGGRSSPAPRAGSARRSPRGCAPTGSRSSTARPRRRAATSRSTSPPTSCPTSATSTSASPTRRSPTRSPRPTG